MSVLAVDFGGSHLSCALVDGSRILSEQKTITSANSLAATLPVVAELLAGCVRLASIPCGPLTHLVVGFCGIVDSDLGQILSTLDKYPDATAVDLHGWAREACGLELLLENDACLALVGEHARGAAQSAGDVVMVTLGTGIGGAAMLGGRLLRSRTGQAGCLGGHLPVNFRGRRCVCGAIGCAEAEASTWMLPTLCREHPGFAASTLAERPVLDFATVFAEQDAGDRVAQDVVAHCVQVWSTLAVGLVHAYGPEIIVFGGSVSLRGEALLAPIRTYVEAHAWRTGRGVTRIVPAELGPSAALLGAAAFAAQRLNDHGGSHAD